MTVISIERQTRDPQDKSFVLLRTQTKVYVESNGDAPDRRELRRITSSVYIKVNGLLWNFTEISGNKGR